MSSVTVRVATARPYDVHVGAGNLARVRDELAGNAAAVLTDANVEGLYLAELGLDAPCHVVPAGEDSKSLTTLERVLDFCVSEGLSRRSRLVALGGGVIGDLGGLAASLYQRGIEFVQVPTTLLAQVDSSVGGKTAVNLAGGKNLAGTFHQPCVVIADTETLKTLSEPEYQSGLGEVIKTALIGDADLFELLEREHAAVRDRDPETMISVVERCVRVKARVVAADEREGGPRKSLNLGHTFGHAIEHSAGYGTIPHGIAVATGLMLAAQASERASLLRDTTLSLRLRALLEKFDLPTDLTSLRNRYGVALSPESLIEGMRHDKKGEAGEPRFVLLESLGQPRWDDALEGALLSELLA